MFPVNVRFKDNRFAYLGDDYEMPRMGLAVAAEFKAEGTSENRTSLVMESSDDTLVHYPFPFRLEIVGEVNGLTLKQTYTVTNTGDEALYFALGGHPGFRAPFIHGRDRSDYEIRFADKLTVEREVVSDSLLTGERVSFLRNEDRFSLDDPRIPDGGMFLRDQPSPQISLALKGRSPYVTLDLDDFPNVNLWSPPGMPYACFEPMLGHHDLANTPEAIEEKEYLIHLPAGESRSYQFSIAIHPSEGELALN